MTRVPTGQPGRHQALLEAAEQLGQFGSWEWIPAESDLLWSDNLFRIAHVVWHDGLVEIPEFEALTRTARLPRGVGLPGRAWEREEPVNVVRVAESSSRPRAEAALREGLRRAVAIPVTYREHVLAVVLGGQLEHLSARDAAERLFVSAATVRTHLENIYAKLGASDKASAVAKALRLGLIT